MHPISRFLSAASLIGIAIGFPFWHTASLTEPNLSLSGQKRPLAQVEVQNAEEEPPPNSNDVELASNDEDEKNFAPTKPLKKPRAPIVLTDINGHFAQEAAVELVSQNIVSPYLDGSLKPDELLTKLDLLTLTLNAFGYPTENPENTAYTLGWIGDEIKWASERSASVSRAEAVKILVEGGAFDTETRFENNFKDVDSIRDWFAPYSALALEKQWVHGNKDGEFKGNEFITRGEFFVILARSLHQP